MMNVVIKKKQSGVALIVSLIMLLLMTLLGVTAVKTSLIEEKMAGNSRDVTLAFQAGETALREAEQWLTNQTDEPEPDNTASNRVWTYNAMDPDVNNAANWWQERNQSWWAANAVPYSGSGLTTVNTPPATVIEYKQFVPDTLVVGSGAAETGITYYQVTAKGTGGSDQARVLLQSTTARRY